MSSDANQMKSRNDVLLPTATITGISNAVSNAESSTSTSTTSSTLASSSTSSHLSTTSSIDEANDNDNTSNTDSVVDNEKNTTDGLPTGLIIGVVVALCVVCCIVAIVLVWLIRRRDADDNNDTNIVEVASATVAPHSEYGKVELAEYRLSQYSNPFDSVRDDYSLDLHSVGGR